MRKVDLLDIWKARKRIASIAQPTSLVYSNDLSDVTGKSVYLKMENWNITNSFKIRGAANKILSLTPMERAKGITTFSTGNFGVSVGYVAKQLDINAVICISNRVPKAKVDVLRSTGACVEVIGTSQDDAEKYSYQLQREHGFTVIHPFDDPYVIAGYGTMGLELLETLPEVDTVLAGLSGGGMHSGLGVALKQINPKLHLIGVSTERGAAMYESMQAGKPMEVTENNTLADSLLGGIGLNNQYTFSMVQQYVNDILLVNEQQIAKGMAFMLDKHHQVIEGAAAASIGAILENKATLIGSNVVLIISGNRVDTSVVLDLAKRYSQ
ncbi:pyridoxal-phosphate dependent enzyme [Virgibacillus sp. Bac332]|uniref:pyridoxal-phosphate dependent enzyme n=1 Tax=Virgibacillus sp. Bac332 TaxID=2419842 RepID=UPI000EF4B89E|nr:pyridoxal-phosphate dependent enzyme [Virgibacillus sp. Bac332]